MKEVLPQFVVSLCVFCAILVISQLARITEILVTFGFSLENVLFPFVFVVLPFLSFIIPMAYLFAVLLAFSRLNADGEYTALLAAGYSLKRASVPILVVSGFLYVIGALGASYLEPWGRRAIIQFYQRKAQTELDNMLKFKLQPGVFMEDFLGFVLYAEKISPDRTHFDNMMLAPRSGDKGGGYTLLAPSGEISGSVDDGDLRLAFNYGVIYDASADSDVTNIVKFKRMELDLLRIFRDQIYNPEGGNNDYRAFPPAKLRKFIVEQKNRRELSPREAFNLNAAEYLFHQRIALPFAVIVFAMLAMVLGIQDQRRGKSSAYLGAILSVVIGYVVAMSFKWLSEHGHLAPFLGAWLPNVIMFLFAWFLCYQKNRLPPSEGTLDPHNIPYLNRFYSRRILS